ncbi:MAG: hypothetical protein WCT77_01765, partial [Bacteroidota bacterium]
MTNVKNEVVSIKDRINLVFSRINRELIMLSKTSEVKRLIDNFSQTEKENDFDFSAVEDQIVELFKNGLYFKVEFIDKNGRKFSSIFFDSSGSYITPQNKLLRKPLLFYIDIITDMKNGEIKLSPSEIKMPENGKITPSIDCIFPIFNNDNQPKAIIIASIHAENFFKLFSLSNRDTNIKVV